MWFGNVFFFGTIFRIYFVKIERIVARRVIQILWVYCLSKMWTWPPQSSLIHCIAKNVSFCCIYSWLRNSKFVLQFVLQFVLHLDESIFLCCDWGIKVIFFKVDEMWVHSHNLMGPYRKYEILIRAVSTWMAIMIIKCPPYQIIFLLRFSLRDGLIEICEWSEVNLCLKLIKINCKCSAFCFFL